MDNKLLDPEWLLETGNRIMAQRRNASYICAATERAIPLASFCALLGTPAFYRRDSAKAHGNKRSYEGAAAPRGASVAVVGFDEASVRIAERELLDMGYEVVVLIVVESDTAQQLNQHIPPELRQAAQLALGRYRANIAGAIADGVPCVSCGNLMVQDLAVFVLSDQQLLHQRCAIQRLLCGEYDEDTQVVTHLGALQ